MSEKRLIKHVAISLHGIKEYSDRTNRQFKTVFREQIKKVKDIVKKQLELKIPIATFLLASARAVQNEASFGKLVDAIVEFFKELKELQIIHKEKVKVSFLGKWYNLPNRVIDVIKEIIDETKDYDGFFLNFCINYDGQEELVDACKLIARKVQAGKLDIDSINKDLIKENIYSSYFLPPDLIIITGSGNAKGDFLLWDSTRAILHFSKSSWPEFTEKEFERIIEKYNSPKQVIPKESKQEAD